MGSVAKPISQGLGAVATGGLSLIPGNNPFSRVGGDVGNVLTGGASGQPLTNPFNGESLFGQGANPYVPGPFSLDPNQVSGDENAITSLGSKQQTDINDLANQQYQQTLTQIPQTVGNQLTQEMPQIAESANANGVLTSSAYPQALAQQQSYLTQNLEMPAMQQLQQAQQGALGVNQSAQTAAAQRGMSLEDFIDQANVSKSIGASMAPPPPSGKAQTGTLLSGVGALSPFAKLGKGGAGAGAAAGSTASIAPTLAGLATDAVG